MILVGTGGFQYRDWARVFYPADLDPSLWLRYYSRHFGCCELNFTCYRMPEYEAIQQLIEEPERNLQFVFRVPSKMTDGGEEMAEAAQRFAAVLRPLEEAGRLSGVMARFPPDFGFIRDNFHFLCRLQDSLEGIRLVAEFGCPDWLTPKAARHLAAREIALACVDGGTSLREKTFYCATAPLAYVRFQGRNESRWIHGDGSGLHDYLYSRAELAAAHPPIPPHERENERVLVVMNNHWRGQAAINAQMMLELLAREQ